MKRLPYILTKSIQFAAAADHLEEQAHENDDPDNVRAKGAGGGGGGDKSKEGVEKRKADFLSQFSASKNAPPELGGDPDNPSNADTAKNMSEDAKQRAELDKKRDEEKRNRPGGNLPQILEGKRKAEMERDELKKKLETFETEKTTLQTKIEEFEKQIQGGELTPAKVKEYEEKIVGLETTFRERETALVNETAAHKKRLAFYDLANDPGFREQYEAPVVRYHGVAVEIIGDDKVKNEALHRALIANGSALRAQSPEGRRMAEKERDAILSSILGDLGEFERGRFASAMTQYIEASKAHAVALADHEGTTKKMMAEAGERANAAQAERLDTWGRTFKALASNYSDDEKIDPEDVKLAKELGTDLELDIKKANLMAEKVITGQSTMMEAQDFVHRGRVQVVLKARVGVLEKKLADALSVIDKLRGGGTRGGEGGGGGTGAEHKPEKKGDEPVNSKGETRDEFHDRFRPGAKRKAD